MITGNKLRLQTALRWLARFQQAGHMVGGRVVTSPSELAALQRSPAGWPISRNSLCAELAARLAGRTEPDQVETSYCGPAVFLYCLLEDRPDLYVAYAQTLWQAGSFSFVTAGQNMELESTAGAKKAIATIDRLALPARARHLSDLDWMTMSSLSASTRPGGGWLGAPKPTDEGRSITLPTMMRTWFAAVGSRPRADTMGVGATRKSIGDFLKVARNWPNCWIVLQIDTSLLQGGKTNFATQRHWVVMDPHQTPLVKMGAGRVVTLADLPGKITDFNDLDGSDQERVLKSWQTNLRVVSWGKENYAIAGQDLGYLEDRFYGAIAFPRFR